MKSFKSKPGIAFKFLGNFGIEIDNTCDMPTHNWQIFFQITIIQFLYLIMFVLMWKM